MSIISPKFMQSGVREGIPPVCGGKDLWKKVDFEPGVKKRVMDSRNDDGGHELAWWNKLNVMETG